jgi:PAS domain S-box-containing protein/diguanylate cyclase (GGDEF)-like protein
MAAMKSALPGTANLQQTNAGATTQTRVLIVEDMAVEAELITHQLRGLGIPFEWHRVETEAALRAELQDFCPSIVLSDFSLPQFDGLRALEVVRECAPETPFVFVSGTIGEERAINALHRGAADYVLKTNLKRLVPAVGRALKEAVARGERRAIEQRLHDIVRTAQDWIWELDEHFRFVFSSNSVNTILGYSPQQLLGTSLLDHLHDDDRAIVEHSLSSLGAEHPQAERIACRWRHRDGHYRWLESNALALVGESGQVLGFRGAERDVTERREQEIRIARMTRVLQMLSGINNLVVRIRDRRELLQETCRIAVMTGGYAQALIMLRKGEDHDLHPSAAAGIEETPGALHAALANAANTDEDTVARVLRSASVCIRNDISKDAHPSALQAELLRYGCRSFALLPLKIDATVIGVMLLAAREPEADSAQELRMLREVAANISFALQFLQRDSTVRFLSYFNPQTGLARRVLFCERLAKLIKRNPASGKSWAVAILDIERLSVINDSFGRHMGDLLLRHTADRLRRHVREHDLLAQIDGGVFAVAMEIPAQIPDPTEALTDVVGAAFGKPFELDGSEIPVAARSAIAVHSPAVHSDALVQNAEAALRTAKALGERHSCFNAERHSQVVARFTLEHKLRNALELRQFELHYQPKVDVKTRRIEGVEALLRWRDPDAGLVAPGTFIPLLESSGFIVEVGEWIIRQAAQDCQQWREQGLTPVRVAVNISPVQLRRTDFVSRFLALTEPWSSQQCGLDIEITEGTLFDDSDALLSKLQRLRAAGVRIAIDDFGTGYSSLSRLADLPIDTLKIDRSFVARLESDDRHGKTLVRTIVSLARAFKMTVVAEGVETFEQLDVLWTLGCDQSQGFLHSKPVTADEFARLLEHGKDKVIVPIPRETSA